MLFVDKMIILLAVTWTVPLRRIFYLVQYDLAQNCAFCLDFKVRLCM